MKTKQIFLMLATCFVWILGSQAQTVVKTNNGKKVIVNSHSNDKVIVNTHGDHNSNHNSNHNTIHHQGHHGNVIVKNNQHNIIVHKPDRPVYIKRPTLNRRGFIWIEGYWRWNGHTYIWIDGFWERERHGFHWHDGFWEETPYGFFWVEGYWCDMIE